MSTVFDPHKVEIQQHSRGCAMEFEGYVDELDYKTLLLLYDDACKFSIRPEYQSSLAELLLSEDAPDESRPTRTFFNTAVRAAFALGASASLPGGGE